MSQKFDDFTQQTLIQLGLTASQARGYLALIEHGRLTPVELAEKTNESRTNGYQICEKLEKLGLAIKQTTPKTSYTPASPAKLRQLLLNQQSALKAANDGLKSILPHLNSTYRLATDKPGVLHLEGATALQTVYDDIITTGQTLRIFPSAYDRDNPAVAQMIDKQIARQRQAGIKTEVLLRQATFNNNKNDDLFEARLGEFGALDTQIMIYGPNVALTTFNNGVVTTIITSQLVAETFRQLFAVQWDQLESSLSE